VRGVVVHLRDTNEVEVAAFLQRTYPYQQGPPWVCEVDGDDYLRIDFYRDGPREVEPEDWASLTKALGGRPAVSIVVEVSGRHPGDDQVRFFVAAMLGEFQGLAQDDYTKYFWTGEEVLSGHRVRGHPFFDYRGWFEE
jgi:hypothetical protein